MSWTPEGNEVKNADTYLALIHAHKNTYIESGMAITVTGSDTTISVSLGKYYVNGTRYSFAANSIDLAANRTANYNYTIVWVDTSGVLQSTSSNNYTTTQALRVNNGGVYIGTTITGVMIAKIQLQNATNISSVNVFDTCRIVKGIFPTITDATNTLTFAQLLTGQTSITTLGTITTGVWSGTTLIANKVPNHDSLNGYDSTKHFVQSAITTVGTITTGIWQGTPITNSFIAGIDQNLLISSSPTFADIIITNKMALAQIDATTPGYIIVGAAFSGIPTYVIMSGDVTISNSGVTTVANNSHTHTTSNISDLTTTATGITKLGTVTVGNIDAIANYTTDLNHDLLTNFTATEHFIQSAITTVGTITTGIWQGTAISDSYISSASTWNAKNTASDLVLYNSNGSFSSKNLGNISVPLIGTTYTTIATVVSALSKTVGLLTSDITYNITMSNIIDLEYTLLLQISIDNTNWVTIDQLNGLSTETSTTLTHLRSLDGYDMSNENSTIRYRIGAYSTNEGALPNGGTITSTQSGTDTYEYWKLLDTKANISYRY